MNLDQERILITGAAGFVGACLTHRLVTLGMTPHVLVMAQSETWRLTTIKKNIHCHIADITDFQAIKEIVDRIKPTIIYHFAAHGAYPLQQDVKRIMLTNCTGTLNLLQALQDIDYKLFVNIGTSSEYGYKDHPMKETDILAPNSFYALAKANQTQLCVFMAQKFNKPIVTLRLFSLYGPYEEKTRLVPTTILCALQKKSLKMADRHISRDFVYIDDAIDVFLLIETLMTLKGEVINIASETQTTLEDFVDALSKALDQKLIVNWGAYPSRSWDTACWVGDASKAKQLLQWQATTDLTRGLFQTAQWLGNNG